MLPLDDVIHLAITGLAQGCAYGLIALGFVLIYKATEMVNFAQGDLMMLIVPQSLTSALDSFILLAIPFFILSGGIMNITGITYRLIRLATSLVGHLRGGLGQVNIVTSVMMGGLTGSSIADAAATTKTPRFTHISTARANVASA